MSTPITGYTINPQAAQDSIVAFLKTHYPHIPVLPGGLLDTADDKIEKYPDDSIKPFVILWFSTVKRRSRGRAFGGYKLDARYASVDVVVVARDDNDARLVLNDMADRLVGFVPETGGGLHESSSLWGSTRSIDIQNRPTRFAMTQRFDFGVSARKVAP